MNYQLRITNEMRGMRWGLWPKVWGPRNSIKPCLNHVRKGFERCSNLFFQKLTFRWNSRWKHFIMSWSWRAGTQYPDKIKMRSSSLRKNALNHGPYYHPRLLWLTTYHLLLPFTSSPCNKPHEVNRPRLHNYTFRDQ